MVQEASGSHGLLESSGSDEGLELIQEKDTQPYESISEVHNEVALIEEYELGDLNEPPNYKAALSDPEFDEWLEAMNTEMQSIKDNQVWVLVELPPNCRTVGSKWLFKKKTDMDGKAHTFKARLVAKGYTQTYDGFKTTFLNGYLSEDVYMVQPEGFVDPKHANKVCKLQRSIYGLKQASRTNGSNVAFLILYVDDILLMRNNVTMPQEVKSWLCSIMYATAVKTILKYLRNTKDMVLVYGAKVEAELRVSCYADANFQTDKDDTKSQMGYMFKPSTLSAAEASMEAVWMRKFIDGLGDVVPSNKRPLEMLCDNEPAITIANDPRILKGARDFKRKYHYIREVIHEREIVLKKVHTNDNVADPFTKPMPLNKHYEHAMAIGIGYDLPKPLKAELFTKTTYSDISGSIDDVARLFVNDSIDTESKLGADGTPMFDSTLYRSLVGALQHLTFTKPYLSYAIQQIYYGLQLYSSLTSLLAAYLDADWEGCPTTRRSTFGYCVFIGNNLLSWLSKRQYTLSLSYSSAEAEYHGIANAMTETSWL
ncbi:retrotransposon protein, putative, ty1-copia subclass [Tanacetum coccineum]